MSTKAIAASLVVLGLTPLAHAVGGDTLEFEDLTPGMSYPNGDMFMTEGIQVNVGNFYFSSGTEYSGGSASVVNPNGAGAGNGMGMGNVNLDFQFPFPLTTIGFSYVNGGGNVNLMVNGALFNDNLMLAADGMMIGGANVMVAGVVRGADAGFVTIQGHITQFSVGGQEFDLDDVRYVPTPGVAGLLGIGALGFAGRRRR